MRKKKHDQPLNSEEHRGLTLAQWEERLAIQRIRTELGVLEMLCTMSREEPGQLCELINCTGAIPMFSKG